MSQKYTGGFITKSPVAPTSSAASGIWTLDQQQQAQKAGTWPSPPIFIEDIFSTYLYTGTDAAQTITNGINLSGNGGMIWWKSRSNVSSNLVQDTTRGITKVLRTNTTDAETTETDYVTSVSTTGFSVGASLSVSPRTYATWTFRKQPKFFDVVTYTGTGSATTIAHNLGSVPGCIIVKRTDSAGFDWAVYHTSTGNTQRLLLNTTDPAGTSSSFWNNTTPTSTVFTVGSNVNTNASGGTYVACLFAHNAGGFPVSGGGSTNGISCGSWTGTGSTFNVNLGYEPQWLMFKRTDDVGDWIIIDNMRGFTTTGADAYLRPNTSGAESNITGGATPNSTGFSWATGAGSTFIYIAIRRGPMKTPTVGTSVYNAIARTGTGATANVTGVGFPVDLNWSHIRDQAYPNVMDDRLRGSSNTLKPSTTDGEASSSTVTSFASMDGVQYGTSDRVNTSPNTYINWYFRRAPGFFDEVCYTGTGVATTVTHNLGVVPEMMIVKCRSDGGTSQFFWAVYVAPLGNTANLVLDDDSAIDTGNQIWNNTSPTSSVFSVFTTNRSNALNKTYVAYLFATLAGVSKVGSYTGTGALQTINCGFTSGARFVLIKRSDSTGNWYIYDSVRGITSGNDPYLFADLDAVEATGTNYVDTDTTGFKVTAAAPAGLNANGGTYIFLAIA